MVCKRARMRKYAAENKEQENARSNAYYKEHQERLDFERSERRWQNVEEEKAKKRARDHANPEKVKAHNAVRRAIEKGKLPKVTTCMCADCEKPAQEYHHPDYDKPLWVVPLCKPCHVRRHAPQVQGEVLGQAMPEMRGVSEVCTDSDSDTDEGTG